MGKKKIETLFQEIIIIPRSVYVLLTIDKTVEKNNFSYISLKLKDVGHTSNFYEKYCFENILDTEGNITGKRTYTKDEILKSIDTMVNERYPVLKIDLSSYIKTIESKLD